MTDTISTTRKHFTQTITALSALVRIFTDLSPRAQRLQADNFRDVQDTLSLWREWVRNEKHPLKPFKSFSQSVAVIDPLSLCARAAEQTEHIFNALSDSKRDDHAEDRRVILATIKQAETITRKAFEIILSGRE